MATSLAMVAIASFLDTNGDMTCARHFKVNVIVLPGPYPVSFNRLDKSENPMVNWDGEAIGPTHVGIPDEGDDCSKISQVTLEMNHEFFAWSVLRSSSPARSASGAFATS